MSDVLTARGLRKFYRSGDRTIEVLRGVDLALAPGESVSIRGESGSGKSTLLHLLAALDRPDAGEVRWEGTADLGARRRGRFVGMVFQAFYLVPELSARENILLAARIGGGIGAESRQRTEELLQAVGLRERGHHYPGQLSGGERQRVAVARALMNRPRLILADEPTGNLDERTGDEVIELLMGLCATTSTALALVTHNAAHAAKAARSLLLHEGVLRPL
ncbi:MAG TPA: ABC transporter ATP-binding protein [Opitutaceae bacterium]|jgi:predicted ABC-type transport system involved in lysophospholipase L1 biosynthesis ATPase subunit|nr:ABC transporter ATP-binding protein [Opitutaceae bacterium]